MSGTGNSQQELFARAASLLLGNPTDATGDHEARLMLQALEYADDSRTRFDPLSGNRAALLNAASCFARVFELSAPDAPGLIAFGAQFDPALADNIHQGSPIVGVSGVGLTLQAAFQSCIGEGVEYLSQLQTSTDWLRHASGDNDDENISPNTQELLATVAKRCIQPGRAMTLLRATRVSDGRDLWLPADICLRRPPAERDFVPPYPLSIGSAAGPSRDAAALHGLLELVERDATSLWWRGGLPARSIPPRHAASVGAEQLLEQLRHGVATPRRTWLLDITTDIGVPCVAAVSCRPDGAGFAFGLAARPLLEAAARSAVVELCQLELADAVVATKRNERGDDALNAQDRIHLQRAAIHVDHCKLLHPTEGQADHLTIHATEESDIFGLIVERLAAIGVETLCIDLTRQQFAVPVVRVIAPGLQLEPSEIVTARLRNTIARTGGGASYTGSIALI